MADRYWVGGTGTWDTTAGTKWATTSGGAGGASVPTGVDNVYFDAASGAAVVTLSSSSTANSIICTGFTGSFLGSAQVAVYGGLTLSSTMTHSNTLHYIFAANSGSWSITTAGKTISRINIGNGATTPIWTLGDALTVTSELQVYSGTFTTNNFNIDCDTFSFNAGNSKAINLGASTVTISSTISCNSTTGLTFNAGTSTLVFTSGGLTVVSPGLTFYNVSLTGGGTTSAVIQGSNTFNNLSVTATTAGTRGLNFSANQTINGTLSVSGTTATRRVQFSSSVAGTQRTLSVATIGTLTNTNWKDIALTGAGSPWSAPLGVWDLGNNSGITFDTTTLYWIGGAGTWNDGTKWSTSSGGSAANAAPGAQNSVVFDASSGTGTVTCGSGYCNDFTGSSSSALTFSGINLVYGSVALGGSGTFTSWTPTYLATTTGKTINVGGKGTGIMTFNGSGGEWTLQSNLTCNFTLTQGTFNTNGYNISLGGFTITGTLARTLNLGSSTITFNGGSGNITATDTTNLTFNAGTSTIVSSVSNSFTVTGSAGLSFYNMTINGYNGANVRFLFNGNNTFTGTLTATGYNAAQRVNIMSNTFGTQYTLTAAAVSLTDVNFYGVIGAGAASWSGTRLGDGTLNSGITFDAPKTVYWNLAAGGDWVGATAWATSSGGTPALNNFPLPQDTAIIENTGLNTGATINSAYAYTFMPNVDLSTRSNTMDLPWTSIRYFCGNLTFSSAVTTSSSFEAIFFGSTTITSAGLTFPPPFTVAAGATLTNADALTLSNLLTNNGTLTLGANATFTRCTLGAASTTNFGTGKIVLTGNATTIFTGNATQTVTGTPIVECNYSGATGTRTINASTPTEANSVSFNITAGTDIVALSTNAQSSTARNLDFTGFSGTFASNNRTVCGNLTLSTGMTLAAGATTTLFGSTSGTKIITTNGKTLDFIIAFNGIGGTWQLADNLTQGSTRQSALLNGTIDLNGKTYTAGSSFQTGAGSGVKNLTFNGGTLVCPAASTTAFHNPVANFTTTAGTGTGKISMTAATAKTFSSSLGAVYNCTLENAGAGALTITGSNTFTTISNSVQPTSFLFTAGTTTTVTNFNVSGTSGNLVTIGSATASNHTLSKASGLVDVSYCTISRSTATGGARWQAYTANGNVDGGNNTGWLFSAFSGNGLFFGSNF